VTRRPTQSPIAVGAHAATFGAVARVLHWGMAGLLCIQMPLGIYMAYRGGSLDIWDALTNRLYATHKLIGGVLLLLVAVRLAARWRNGAPPPAPPGPAGPLAEKLAIVALYALLVATPLIGYLGISYYPSLDVFGLKLPGIVRASEAGAKVAFAVHKWAAFALAAIALAHIAVTLYRHWVLRDGIVGRMLPPRRE